MRKNRGYRWITMVDTRHKNSCLLYNLIYISLHEIYFIIHILQMKMLRFRKDDFQITQLTTDGEFIFELGPNTRAELLVPPPDQHGMYTGNVLFP